MLTWRLFQDLCEKELHLVISRVYFIGIFSIIVDILAFQFRPKNLHFRLVLRARCAADANDLQTANVAINNEGFFGTFVMVPVVDGELIVERPVQTISRGKLNGVRAYWLQGISIF